MRRYGPGPHRTSDSSQRNARACHDAGLTTRTALLLMRSVPAPVLSKASWIGKPDAVCVGDGEGCCDTVTVGDGVRLAVADPLAVALGLAA